MLSVEAAAVNELSPVCGHLIPGWSIPTLRGTKREKGRRRGRGRRKEGGGGRKEGERGGGEKRGEREGGRREGKGEGGRWGVERRKTMNGEK